MKTRRYVISGLLFAAMLCRAQKSINPSQTESFTSPDGTMTAFVRSTRAPEATKESRIEVRSKGGRVLVSRSYISQDGEHGQGVRKAAWTPDSRFFVYSLESSGGHQAWHTPVHFFSRNRDEIANLDDVLKDAVINPQFVVSAPDSITVELQSKRSETVSLYDITRRPHKSPSKEVRTPETALVTAQAAALLRPILDEVQKGAEHDERRLSNLLYGLTEKRGRAADEALVVLMCFDVGELQEEADAVIARGKKMLPLLDKYQRRNPKV